MRVGIDVTSVKRFKKHVESDAFLNKNFTNYEIEYIFSRLKPEESMAGLFAAKESFLKALEIGIYNGVSMLKIEVLHKESGAPFISVSSEIKQKYNIKETAISIAHDGGIATAICIIN